MPIYRIGCAHCGEEFKKLLKNAAELDEYVEGECGKCGRKSLKGLPHSLSSLKFGQAAKDITMKTRFKKRNSNLEKMPAENQERMKKFMHEYGVRKEH